MVVGEADLGEQLLAKGATAGAFRVQGLWAGRQGAGGLAGWPLGLIAGDTGVMGADDRSVLSALPASS